MRIDAHCVCGARTSFTPDIKVESSYIAHSEERKVIASLYQQWLETHKHCSLKEESK